MRRQCTGDKLYFKQFLFIQEECEDLLDEILKDMDAVRCPFSPDDVTIRNHGDRDVTARPPRPGVMERPMALIIDGVSLSFTLSKSLNTKFIEIARHCESVICCRATPLQKVSHLPYGSL